jgi:hypothetical protein
MSTVIDQEARRLDIGLSTEDYEELAEIASKIGVPLDEYIGNAIRVYSHIQRVLDEGEHVYLGRNGIAEKELVIP